MTPPAASDSRPAAAPLLARPLLAAARRVRETPPRWLAWSLAGVAGYLAAMRLSSGLRPEHALIAASLLALVVAGEGTRRFLLGLLPFVLFGITYDLTHITEPLVRHLHVHVAEPYHFDQALFGIRTARGVLTPNEFFAEHHGPAADLVAGFAYIFYVYWSVLFSAYLTLFRRDAAGRHLNARYGWTFYFLNLAGFVTYYVYPAAPPWYVADYGLGPANLAARSSAAAAIRFDQLTGLHYFSGFYGRSADVFGAIPSLHIAYPLMTFLYARALGKRWLDAWNFAFFLLVCFAAVYLQHHYVLDVLLGVAYTLAAWGIDGLLERRRRRQSSTSTSRMPATSGPEPSRARAR